MIYESTVLQTKAVNEEKELNEFFEQVENRFEYDTIAEATATVISEQEENWNRFMKAVGISELATVMEGEEVVYEGARLDALKNTFVKWFKSVKEKLAQLTKAFMAKVDQFVAKIDAGILKKLKAIKVPAGFKYKGYTFKNLDELTPKYEFANIPADAKKIIEDREKYTKEQAVKDLVGVASTEGLQKALRVKFYGSENMVDLTNISLEEQYKYIASAGAMKSAAKKSYAEVSKKLDKIIKNTESVAKSAKDDNSLALNIIGTYYKAFANASTTVHSAYMQAIGARSRQALSICMAAAREASKVEKAEKKAHKDAAKNAKKNPDSIKQLANNEGYVDTGAFLGAVEFI